METKNKIRPHWHINAKWMIGLVLVPIFALTFFAFNLFMLTNRENGIKTSANIISALYSPHSNVAQSLIAVRQAIEKSPDKSFYPFPDKSIKITASDLNKYSGEELKNKLYTQLAASIYDSEDSSLKSVGFLFAFTKAGHAFISKIFFILLPVTLVLLALVIYFSAGFGRLVTPGIIALLVGTPLTLILTLLQKSEGPSTVPAANAGWSQMALFIVRSLIPQFELLRKNYLLLTLVGLGLIAASIIGVIIRKIIKKKSE